jgi:pyruvate dehydrogenase E2 component (dihydrolipoamide acetyltransferase)
MTVCVDKEVCAAMAIEITIPPLGWSADDGVFSGWLKNDGDQVKPGDELFSLEGEKATQEIESFDAGTLRILPSGPKVGDKVAVGVVIGYLLAPGESLPTAQALQHAAESTAQSNGAAEPARSSEPIIPTRSHATPAMRRLARSLGVDVRKVNSTGDNANNAAGQLTTDDLQRQQPSAAAGAHAMANSHPSSVAAESSVKTVASPRARRVAVELGVDWTALQGGGSSGRVRERDVRAAAEHQTVAMAPGSTAADAQKHPVTTLRKTIAGRMLESSQSTAAVTLTTTLCVTNLVNLRSQFKELAVVGAIEVPSYTDFLAKLVAAALRQYPLLNSRFRGDHIEVLPTANIGIAVDTEAGLVVPVLRDVGNLRLPEVVAKSRDLIERARQRKLSAEDMQDGTFTITNLGAFGIDSFTPIINYPQAAILGVGRIRREPTVVDNQIAIRDVVTLSLSFDHRIVDGAPAARFLQHLGELIKNPAPCLTA